MRGMRQGVFSGMMPGIFEMPTPVFAGTFFNQAVLFLFYLVEMHVAVTYAVISFYRIKNLALDCCRTYLKGKHA